MFALALACLAAPAPPAAQQGVSSDEARTSISRAVKWLVDQQKPDGSWGAGAADSVQWLVFSPETFYAFKMGADSIACMALMAVEETPERRASLERGLEWLVTARIPKRGNDWDIDCSWSALWGFNAVVRAAQDPRFQTPEWKRHLEERGLELYRLLERNQEPLGGWGYYEGPVVSRRPTWSTSFSTACVIPALVEAQEKLGWPVDPQVTGRAAEYIKKCALPNGAYEYDLNPVPRMNGGEHINDVKGSLGRIQVCNWARRRAGDKSVTDEKVRAGIAAFFEHHKFLDVARMRPVPHEAYYANAAYFYFFGHYHAALAIQELPREEREPWQSKLRAELVKVQWADGSSLDFPNMSSMQVAGTSFSILALQAGLAPAR